MAFDSLGNLDSPSGGLIQAAVTAGGATQNITIDLSRSTSLADQNGIFVQNVSQDGYISGILQSTYFTSTGVLVGSYSNQEVKPLYKLALANFANKADLEALPGNVFAQTAEAGALSISSVSGSLSGTGFVPGAVEKPNADLGEQFSKMIITSVHIPVSPRSCGPPTR